MDSLSRNAALGVQGYLHITNAPAAKHSLIGSNLFDAGALNTAGDYDCDFDSAGLTNVEAHLKPSAVTGTVTPFLQALFENQSAVKDHDDGVGFVAGTLQSLGLTDLMGVRKCRVKITVANGGSVTFAGNTGTSPTAQAEYNGL